MIWRGKWLLLVCAAVFGTVAWLLCLRQVPVYQARMSLEFLATSQNQFRLRDVNLVGITDSGMDSYIQTQAEILQDESTLRRVVDQLKPGKYQHFGLAEGRSAAARSVDPPLAQADKTRVLRMVKTGLRVRPLAQTRLIKLTFDSPDPVLAADILNALAAEYIGHNLQVRGQSNQQLGDWLSGQLSGLKSKLEKSESNLQQYAGQTGLLFTREKDSIAEERLRQMQDELSRAQADRMAKQAQYEMAAASVTDWPPHTFADSALRDYRVKLTELRRELADLSALLTPTHYKVQRVQAQITEIEAAIQGELAGIRKRLENDYRVAQSREAAIAAVYERQAKLVAEQAASAIHYNTLKREVDAARDFHLEMTYKLQEAAIASALQASNVRAVAPAQVPTGPYKPNVPLTSLIGVFAGLCAGIMIITVRQQRDRSVKAPGDAQVVLGLPELSAIPSAGAFGLREGRRTQRRAGMLIAGGGQGLGAWSDVLADSLRGTLVSLQMGADAKAVARIVVITSPGPTEGKSTIASNLGVALAKIRSRVLLIDGDMRRPILHRMFECSNADGLSDILSGTEPITAADVESKIQPTKVPNLFLLPSGASVPDASYLLYNDRLRDLIRLLHSYDAIFIDAPPILSPSDARLLARVADGAILVLRARRTTREAATIAAQRLLADGIPVLGTILNDWDPRTESPYLCNYDYYRTHPRD